MKKYLKIFAPMVLVILAGALTIAFAQTKSDGGKRFGGDGFGRGSDGPHGGGGMQPGLLAQLDLTDQQKEQIKTLQESSRTAAQANFEKMKTFQDQLQAATENGSFNEAQVRQILNDRAQVQIELELARLKTDAAVFNLLTAEQKAKLTELRQKAPKGRPEGFRPAPSESN